MDRDRLGDDALMIGRPQRRSAPLATSGAPATSPHPPSPSFCLRNWADPVDDLGRHQLGSSWTSRGPSAQSRTSQPMSELLPNRVRLAKSLPPALLTLGRAAAQPLVGSTLILACQRPEADQLDISRPPRRPRDFVLGWPLRPTRIPPPSPSVY